MPADRSELFRAAHAAVWDFYGDKEQVAAVVVSTRSGMRIKIDVPAWWHPPMAAVEPANQSAPPSAPKVSSGCSAEIIQALRAAGARMTGEQLVAELARRGCEFSLNKVRSTAVTLVELELLTNDQDANPKGYGLPEWNEERTG